MKQTCKCGKPCIKPGVQNRCRDCQRAYQRKTRHAWKKQPKEYFVWRAMISRCHNSTDPAFSSYGERGISVCERWRLSFATFLLDMGHRPDTTTIERVNNNGNYEPGNCIWASRHVQQRNRRNNIRLSFNGKTQCLADWATELGINRVSLYGRIVKLGWSVQRALTEPIAIRRRGFIER